MVKKHSAKSKGKKTAQAQKAPEASAGSAPASSTEPPPKRRRQLGRRDSSEKINRQIKTHFGGLSQMELANTLVDGKNVRQRVEEDYAENKKSGGQRMSASYWRNSGHRVRCGRQLEHLGAEWAIGAFTNCLDRSLGDCCECQLQSEGR